MNQKEWKRTCKVDRHLLNWEFYSKARKVQKSLQYNSDPNAVVIHHLRDTEEQRKYNDEHYELWGFNEDGTFEYGKYVVFVTKEEHVEIHKASEETRKKISDANKGKCISEETRKKISESTKAFWCTDEGRQISSKNSKKNWANEDYRNNLITKMNSDEAKERRAANRAVVSKKISESKKGYHHTEEAKRKMSESHLGKPTLRGEAHPFFGKPAHNRGVPMSNEAKQKSREKHLGKSSAHLKACQILYKAYKQGNGMLSWNDFQRCISSGYISFELFPITIYMKKS